MGASPVITVAVIRDASHQPRKVRRVAAAALSPAAQVPVMLPVVAEELVAGADAAAPRMARIGPSSTLDVGDHAQQLLSDDLGVAGHADDVADRLRPSLLAVGA